MLFFLRAEPQRIHQLQRIAQAVATTELVLNLTEYLADLVFDSIRPGSPLPEALEMGKQHIINKGNQVVTGQRGIVIKRTVGRFRGSPLRPLVLTFDDEVVRLADQLRRHRPFLLQVVQVLEKQHPRRLLGVVQLGRTARFFPENIIDIFKGLLKHLNPSVWR